MIKQFEKGLIEPSILKAKARNAPIGIFLCGPGVDHHQFPLREKIKQHLENYYRVDVFYGEDIEKKKYRTRIKKAESDLQTLESIFAHQMDFTVLMLDSPGAIAELGAFSMISSIRPRLYTLVSERYFDSQSYISRGPLSILAKDHSSNVIYYKEKNFRGIIHNLDWAVTFYKYMKTRDGYYNYNSKALNPDNRAEYKEYIKEHYQEFIASSVLIAIICLDAPYFSEIVNLLRLSPDEISKGLKILHSRNAIKKYSNRYVSNETYKDEALQLFNSSTISRKKAYLFASNRAA